MQQDVIICKEILAEANNKFEIERKRDDSLISFGQPVRAKMESILYEHGIYESGAFGGIIYGNDCCRLANA